MVAFTMILFSIEPKLFLLIVLFTITGGVITFFLIRFYDRKKVQKKILQGIKLEHEAQHLLKKEGYNIISHHAPLLYTIKQDNIPIPIQLELDYVVSKNGKTFFAEVKSGEHTATIHYAPTRRQMLEYAVAGNYNGYLLVDMFHKKIHHIEFPIHIKRKHPRYFKYGLVCIGIAIILANFAFKEFSTIGNVSIIMICIVWAWILQKNR